MQGHLCLLDQWSESCGSNFTAQEGCTIVQEDSCSHWSEKANSTFREEVEDGGILLMTKCEFQKATSQETGQKREFGDFCFQP